MHTLVTKSFTLLALNLWLLVTHKQNNLATVFINQAKPSTRNVTDEKLLFTHFYLRKWRHLNGQRKQFFSSFVNNLNGVKYIYIRYLKNLTFFALNYFVCNFCLQKFFETFLNFCSEWHDKIASRGWIKIQRLLKLSWIFWQYFFPSFLLKRLDTWQLVHIYIRYLEGFL